MACRNLCRMVSLCVASAVGGGERQFPGGCLFLGVELTGELIHSISSPFMPGTVPGSGLSSVSKTDKGLPWRSRCSVGRDRQLSEQIHSYPSATQRIEINGWDLGGGWVLPELLRSRYR